MTARVAFDNPLHRHVHFQPALPKRYATRHDYSQLPHDVLLLIFSLLDPPNLCKLARVSRLFCCLASKDVLWQQLITLHQLPLELSDPTPKKQLFLDHLLKTAEIGFHALISGQPFITDLAITNALGPHACYLKRIEIEVKAPRLCLITGAALQEIARRCPVLREFHLISQDSTTFPNLTNGDISCFTKRLKEITHLTLEECSSVTETGLLACVDNCMRLRQFSVKSSAFSDFFVKALVQKHRGLEALKLCGRSAKLSDDSLEAIKQLTQLTSLDIQVSSHPFTKNVVKEVITSLPKVRSFVFNGCLRVSDTFVQTVCEGFRHLQILYLGQCCKVTKQSIDYLANCCLDLSSLTLLGCKEPEKLTKYLQSRLPSMQKLEHHQISASAS